MWLLQVLGKIWHCICSSREVFVPNAHMTFYINILFVLLNKFKFPSLKRCGKVHLFVFQSSHKVAQVSKKSFFLNCNCNVITGITVIYYITFCAAVAGRVYGTWAFSGDLPDLIYLLILSRSRRNYRSHQHYTKTQYNKAWLGSESFTY